MAMYDEKWKQAEAARIAKNRAGAVSTAGSVGNWAAYGGAQPGPAKPMFAAPDYTKPNPTNQPVMTAAVAKPAIGAVTAPTPPATASAKLPMPNFANVAGGSTTSYGPPANPARRPGSQAGAGAPSAAGTAALRPGDPNTFTGTNGVTRPVPGTMAAASNPVGSVQSQNFGNAAVPQPQAGIARPGAVASSYGLSVLDPRANDQNAASIARPSGTLRGADQMAEQYASRESREAAQKLMGDMDTDLFRLSFKAGQGGRNGRAAMEAMGAIRNQQNNIAGGLNKLAADATQGRANRDNTLANTGLEQQGAERRAMLDADVTREGQQLGFQSDLAKTAASMIQRPETVTTADGTLMRIGGDGPAQAVVDAQGNPVRGPQAKASGQVTPQDVYNGARDELDALLKAQQGMAPDPAQQTRIEALRQQIASMEPKAKPDYSTFAARAKAQGSRMTEAQLKAAYANL